MGTFLPYYEFIPTYSFRTFVDNFFLSDLSYKLKFQIASKVTLRNGYMNKSESLLKKGFSTKTAASDIDKQRVLAYNARP